MTAGAGPVLSYIAKRNGDDILMELKWVHEFDSERRMAGNAVFLKAVYKWNP
jgi:hypothetical protein